MKKSILLVLIGVFGFITNSQAQIIKQNDPPKNTVYAGGGFALISGHINVNYERVLQRRDHGKFIKTLAFRANLGKYYFWLDDGVSMATTFVGLTGEGNHHLELMLGSAYIYDSSSYNSNVNNADYANRPSPSRLKYIHILPALSVGYRFQKPTGGFMFRAGVGLPEGIFIGLGSSF